MTDVATKIEQINGNLAAIGVAVQRLALFVEGEPGEPGLATSVVLLTRETESLRRSIEEHKQSLAATNTALNEISREHAAIKKSVGLFTKLTLTGIGAGIASLVNSVFGGGKHP